MPISISTHLAGFLLSSESLSFTSRDLAKLKSLRQIGEAFPGWRKCDYLTVDAIQDVDIFGGEPPFHHELILRWGRTSLLALAGNYRIIQYLIKNDLKPLLSGALRQNEIRVHDLVFHMMTSEDSSDKMQEQPDERRVRSDESFFRDQYTLSYAAARTDAFGEDLRKLQFYGDRLSKARLFQESASLMRFYSCTLRRDGTDIIKLGRDGFISFKMPLYPSGQASRLKEVNGILRSLTDHGFVV